MFSCVWSGCQRPATEEAVAVALVLGEEIVVHLCDVHVEVIRRGQLDGLSYRPAKPAKPAKRTAAEVIRLVEEELSVAMERFPSFNSSHEGWAVIREEEEELWEHVKANTGRSPEALAEAVQLAAMAIRYVIDLSPDAP